MGMKADRAKRVRGTLWLMSLTLGLAGGCQTFNKSITESVLEREPSREWLVRYGSRVRYTLTSDTLRDVEFEGTRDANDTVVRYQRGLGPQAQGVAEMTARLLRRVQERTGVTLSTRPTLYLLRFDERPRNFEVVLKAEPNELPLPLFLAVGEESCATILARSRSYPYLLLHELVETSLASGVGGGRVLPDISWNLLLLRVNINNYTRWFREGMANYAGYIAFEMMAAEMAGAKRPDFRETLLHTNPFSSLAQVGDRLFSWPQSANDMESERLYYNAALGLFLLLADTFGEPALRDIMGEIAARKDVNGRDLVRITNQVLKTDVRKLAKDFQFPALGMELDPMSPALALNKGVVPHEGLYVRSVAPDGAARRAGLREKDVIIAVGGTPITNHLDFELGLFKARQQPTVAFAIQRVGTGIVTIELPLQEPAAEKTTPGKRQKPPKKGRVESTYLSVSPGL
jgi:hypothetical protein